LKVLVLVLKLWKFNDTGLHRFANHSTLSELDEYIVSRRDAVLADVNKDWTADDNDLTKKYKPIAIEEITHRYIEENQPHAVIIRENLHQ